MAGEPRIPRWATTALAFVALVGIETLVFVLIRSKGAQVTGDEPHYMIVAKALTHFSVHPLRAYQADLRTHEFYNWPAGTVLTNTNMHLYPGPHGPVSTHGLGLSALLIPFVLIGGRDVAVLGFVGLVSAGFLYIFIRASRLAGLSRPATALFAVLVASPAVLVAGTQVYPDLLTGILMACVLMDMLSVETGHRLDGLGTAVTAFSLAALPWLHSKDLVPAVIVLIAFVVVALRAGLRSQVTIVVIVVAASWLVQLAYNLYDFGHPLGLPQPFPSLNKAGVTLILGLLFDRHQGLFIQVPTTLIGVMGLWLARRTARIAVIATALSALSLIYLNGTFVGAPYGGTSPAGRFEWSAVVPLLAWCPVVIALLSRSMARIWTLGSVVAVMWIVEWVPIFRGAHSYYNQLIAGVPWDLSAYPGWWGRFDILLPAFVPGQSLLGWPGYGLPVVVVLLALGLAALRELARVDRLKWVRLTGGSVVAAAGVVVLALVVPVPLPSRVLTYDGADLGGPIQAGPTASIVSPAVALQGVGAGTFKITVDTNLEPQEGPGSGASGAVGSYCTAAPHGAISVWTTTKAVTVGTGREELDFHCAAGTIWFQMSAGPSSKLAVSDLVLAKTAS